MTPHRVGEDVWIYADKSPFDADLSRAFKVYGAKEIGPDAWGPDDKKVLLHGEKVRVVRIVQNSEFASDVARIVEVERAGGSRVVVDTSHTMTLDFTKCSAEDILKTRTSVDGEPFQFMKYLPVAADPQIKPIDFMGRWAEAPLYENAKFLLCRKVTEAGQLGRTRFRSLECEPYPRINYSSVYYAEPGRMRVMSFDDVKKLVPVK